MTKVLTRAEQVTELTRIQQKVHVETKLTDLDVDMPELRSAHTGLVVCAGFDLWHDFATPYKFGVTEAEAIAALEGVPIA